MSEAAKHRRLQTRDETERAYANPDRLLDRSEVEARFGISKRFLELAAVRGDGPPMVKVGRLVRYQIEDVRTWIAERRTEATG